MAESKELKSLLMKVKEQSENVGLKLNQKTKIMASGPITSWQIDRETMKRVTKFYFGGLQKSLQMVTAAIKLKDVCFLEEKKEESEVVQQCPTLCDPMGQSTRPFCPWDFPSKSTGVGCHFLLQRIFLTQGSNPGLLHYRQILYCLSHQGSPISFEKKLQKEVVFLCSISTLSS